LRRTAISLVSTTYRPRFPRIWRDRRARSRQLHQALQSIQSVWGERPRAGHGGVWHDLLHQREQPEFVEQSIPGGYRSGCWSLSA